MSAKSEWIRLKQEQRELKEALHRAIDGNLDTEEYSKIERKLDGVERSLRGVENDLNGVPSHAVEIRDGNGFHVPDGHGRTVRGQHRSVRSNILSFPAGTETREYAADFERYLRTGEKRDGLALTTATQSTATAVLASQAVANEIENALLYSGPMLKLAKVIPTPTGAPLPIPTSNDTAQEAVIVGEGIEVTESDPTLSSVVLGAFKYSSGLVKVSIELAQDSNWNVGAWLGEQFGLRLGRKLNSDFTIGAGTTLPYGVLTQATLGRTAVGSAANTGGSETGLDTIGSADLLALIHSVDPLYRQNAAFQMHDLTAQAIFALVDKYGRPLFQPPDVDQPPSIFGKPVYINNALDPITVDSPVTARKTVLFGDFSKYYVRQVKELSILRLVERYAEFGQVGFIAFARFDGNLIDAGTHPVKYLAQATS